MGDISVPACLELPRNKWRLCRFHQYQTGGTGLQKAAGNHGPRLFMCLRPIRILGKYCLLRKRALMAQPFDAIGWKLLASRSHRRGRLAPYLDYGFFSASSNGVLVYRSDAGQIYQLTWLDHQGKILATVAETRPLQQHGPFTGTAGGSPFPAPIPKIRRTGTCGCSTWCGTRAHG